MHPGSTPYDLVRHALTPQVLQKGTDVHSEQWSDHRRSTKYRRGREAISLSKTNVVKTIGSTPTSTAKLTTSTLAVMQIVFNPPSIHMPPTPDTNGYNATLLDSARFSRLWFGKAHCEAQCRSIPSHPQQRFTAESENNFRNLPPKPKNRFG